MPVSNFTELTRKADNWPAAVGLLVARLLALVR